MIEVREDNSIRITKRGIEALADCRFQQLASFTIFNYRSMKNNELAIVFALFSPCLFVYGVNFHYLQIEYTAATTITIKAYDQNLPIR